MRDFRGKVSLITGGASGIGLATARELAKRGSHLVLADIHQGRLDEAGQGLRGLGVKVLCVKVDISKESEVSRLADTAVKEMGQVDLLMNNAGVLYMGETRQMTLETWEWIFGINVWGPIRLTHALLPHMLARGSGHIVNTASIAGLVGTPGIAAYSTTKFAVVGFSEALRVELQPRGIDVSVVCPGGIKTNLNESGRFATENTKKANTEGLISKIAYPLGRAAKDIVRGIEKNQAQIVVTPMAHTLWSLKRLSPELFSRFYALLWPALGKNIHSSEVS